jgi:hypothetical protein
MLLAETEKKLNDLLVENEKLENLNNTLSQQLEERKSESMNIHFVQIEID